MPCQGFKAKAAKGITAAIGAKFEAAVFRGDLFEGDNNANRNQYNVNRFDKLVTKAKSEIKNGCSTFEKDSKTIESNKRLLKW